MFEVAKGGVERLGRQCALYVISRRIGNASADTLLIGHSSGHYMPAIAYATDGDAGRIYVVPRE